MVTDVFAFRQLNASVASYGDTLVVLAHHSQELGIFTLQSLQDAETSISATVIDAYHLITSGSLLAEDTPYATLQEAFAIIDWYNEANIQTIRQ